MIITRQTLLAFVFNFMSSDSHPTLKNNCQFTDKLKYFEIIEIPFKCAIGRNLYLLNIETILKSKNDNSSVTSKIRFTCFHSFNIQLILSQDVLNPAHKHMLR